MNAYIKKMGRPTLATTRFVAEWISKQHVDELGDWQPDRDEYSSSNHGTLVEAQKAAVASGKVVNVVEWARVTEEHRTPHPDLPGRWYWEEVRSWTGDWEGNWEEIASYCEQT